MRALIRLVTTERPGRRNRSPRWAILPHLMLLGMSALLLTSTHASAATAASGVQQTEAAAAAEIGDHCEICHDRGMITQQRLTPGQWLAEVRKMRSWGSPVPADKEKSLADYLSSRYRAGAAPIKASQPSSVTLLDALKPLADPAGFHGDVPAGQSIFTDACASCHGADARGGQGPNLVQQPILYRFNDLQEVVMRGRRTMPGFSGVLDRKQIEDLVTWLRTLQTR